MSTCLRAVYVPVQSWCSDDEGLDVSHGLELDVASKTAFDKVPIALCYCSSAQSAP
jgi:hypothetical protein